MTNSELKEQTFRAACAAWRKSEEKRTSERKKELLKWYEKDLVRQRTETPASAKERFFLESFRKSRIEEMKSLGLIKA